MDEIIDKFIKKIPLGLVIGCYMIEYKVVESMFYPGFVDCVIQNIKSVFTKFHYLRITEGTIITSKRKIAIDNNHTMEDISKFLNYPCSIVNQESTEITFVVKYGNKTDILLTIYCDKMNSTLKEFITKINNFINRMNVRLDKPLSLHVRTDKYFTIKKLRRLQEDNKLDSSHKEFIQNLTLRYGYGTLYDKVKNKEINMFTKKNIKSLALLLKLCEIDQMGFFTPTDKKIKEDFHKRFK